MDRFIELQELIETFEKDFQKFYDKGNKAAGIRIRKHMQQLRNYAVDVRKEVQELNNKSENE